MSFYSDLSAATNEDKQVNPIYINAIAKTLPKLGGGWISNQPLMTYTLMEYLSVGMYQILIRIIKSISYFS